jgi:hypothetical protein
MLARSYRVLGENKKAAEALAHAETLAEDLPDGSPLAGAVAAERDAQSGTGPENRPFRGRLVKESSDSSLVPSDRGKISRQGAERALTFCDKTPGKRRL